MQDVSTAHTWLVVPANGSTISLDYKMVTFCAHWMATPTNNSALIAVDGSRSGHILFDNVKADHRWARFQAVRQVTDSEQDLPRQQVREQSRRRWKQRVLRQERSHVCPECSAGEIFSSDCRGRKREKIIEISSDSPLHPLQWLPTANDHNGGGNRRVARSQGRV